MILGVFLTVAVSIACREAGLLPLDQRFQYLWFKQDFRFHRFESKIRQVIYEILRRSQDAELRKVQDKSLYPCVESLNWTNS
jgi:hypothetical protein